MDPRVQKITDKLGKVIVLGRTYANDAEAELKVPLHVAYLEKLAKRRLSAFELLQGGIDKIENRTSHEIIEDNRWTPIVNRPPIDPNPWVANQTQVDAVLASLSPKAETVKQFIRRATNEYQDKLDAAALEDADAARRASAVAHANAHLEKMRFSVDATKADVVKAEQMLRQAKEGDVLAYRTMSEEVTADEQARFERKQVEHNLKVAAALEELEYSKPSPIFEGVPGLGPNEKYEKYHDGSVSHLKQDGDKTVVLASWPAGEVPEYVVEAAQ